ncbi:MAG: restriction endonuclease, SacI family [Legionellales bacterium]|nr:restriction endonuclease, SacI family [Legionellales bacterium]
MKATVNLEEAKKTFRMVVAEVKENNWQPQSIHKELIKNIILGSHLTYRYILMTAALAKYINPVINPLTLQAGSSLPGAYDARSVCHKVIVPLEREILDGKLGASNEPFLNKPARFKELSINNAVRRGRDQETLSQTLTVLSNLNTSTEIKQVFNDIIYYVLQRRNNNSNSYYTNNTHRSPEKILSIIQKFLSKSFEGQVAVLVTAASLKMIFEKTLKIPTLKVHPINQSGASSKEILDIDIYDRDEWVLSVEVKDKIFTATDVEHAVKKIIRSGQNKLLFVMGPRAMCEKSFLLQMEEEWLQECVFLNFIDIFDLVKMSLMFTSEMDMSIFLLSIDKFAQLARVKDGVMNYFDECVL